MTVSLFLQSVIDRIEDSIERVTELSHDLTEQQLNWTPDKRHLTMGQIFDHMLLGTDYYIPEIKKAITGVFKVPADREVYHSWFGRIIIKGSGPSGNVPMPKKLMPGSGPYRMEIVERWLSRHNEIIALARQSAGFDISDMTIRNPLMPVFKMNLADFFEVLAAHAERHVGQIEELSRSMPKPSKEMVGARA